MRRRIWLRRASRYAYNLTLLGWAGALGAGALAWLYLAPPSPPIRLSAAAAPSPPWQLAAWRERAPATRWQQMRQLQSGEDLREFLRQQNISATDGEAALAALAAQYDWRQLEGGQKIALLFAAPPAPMSASHAEQQAEPHNVRFDGLSLSLPPDHWLVLRQKNGWQLVHHVAPMPSRLMLAEGAMASNVYAAARRAGLPPPLAEEWLRLLAYRLHPAAQDWRGGQFQVIYRQKTDAAGRWLADGEIMFFALRHNRRTQAFWRFAPDSGADAALPQPAYVNQAGESLALRFMPTPLAALPRLETSAARYAARHGPPSAVQRFAAPVGTPVLAAADGTVQAVGESARDGKFVRLAHGDGYESFYAQLHAHAPGVMRGRRLRQGERLGTLGAPQMRYVLRRYGQPLPPTENWAPRQILGADAARAFAAWRERQEKQFAVLTARQRSLARSAP